MTTTAQIGEVMARDDLIGRLRDDSGLCKERSVQCRKICDTNGQQIASQIADDLDEAAWLISRMSRPSRRLIAFDRRCQRAAIFGAVTGAAIALIAGIAFGVLDVQCHDSTDGPFWNAEAQHCQPGEPRP